MNPCGAPTTCHRGDAILGLSVERDATGCPLAEEHDSSGKDPVCRSIAVCLTVSRYGPAMIAPVGFSAILEALGVNLERHLLMTAIPIGWGTGEGSLPLCRTVCKSLSASESLVRSFHALLS